MPARIVGAVLVALQLALEAEAATRRQRQRRRQRQKERPTQFLWFILYASLVVFTPMMLVGCWRVSQDPAVPRLLALGWEKTRSALQKRLGEDLSAEEGGRSGREKKAGRGRREGRRRPAAEDGAGSGAASGRRRGSDARGRTTATRAPADGVRARRPAAHAETDPLLVGRGV
jgi:hypothetical protein